MDAILRPVFTTVRHWKSASEPYPGCLAAATRDILLSYLDDPVLVVEDDVAFAVPPHEVDAILAHALASKADAVYLGLSKCGMDECVARSHLPCLGMNSLCCL